MKGGFRGDDEDESAAEKTHHGGGTLEDELSTELAVLHRVFRYNFRNRLNVILGQAELARERTDDEVLKRYLGGILDEIDTLTETVDQVSFIQDLASSDYTPDAVDVTPTLRRLVAEYDEQSDATFESSIPDSVWVWLNPSYEKAFRELIDNAVVHNDAPDPQVSVRVKRGETTEVHITDNGPGMPQGTRDSLESTNVDETDHLTSLGLWTAYWILTRSGGRFVIEDNETRGCHITVLLQTAPPPSE